MEEQTKKIYRCNGCGRKFFFKESYSDHSKLRDELGKCPELPKRVARKRMKKKELKPGESPSGLTAKNCEDWT